MLIPVFALIVAHAEPCESVASGAVMDALSGTPVPGASVAVADEVVAYTDADGRFQVRTCEPLVSVRIRAGSYHARQVSLTPIDDNLVELYPHSDSELVVVESAPLGLQETRSTTTLTERELDAARGDDLGSVVDGVAGVTVADTGAGRSKPIIRGQFGRRLSILVDRVRHEGQKWGIDHAPEVDPFGAAEITVVRGAAGVRYGTDAVGGVLLVDSPDLREEPGVDASLYAVGGLNGTRGTLAARVDAVPAAVPSLAVRLEANAGTGAARRAPDYVLGNTASREYNLGATIGWEGPSAHIDASWRRFSAANGVCFCVKSESIEGFQAAVERDRPLGSENWTADFRVDRPRQRVTHDRVVGRGGFDFGDGSHLDVTVAFQLNRRLEEDTVRGDADVPQLDFLLRTTSVDAAWSHAPGSFGDATLEGSLGVTGMLQENVFRGVPLVPNYRAFGASVYGWERLWRDRSAVEVGARYDHQTRSAFLTDNAHFRHRTEGTLGDEDCEETDTAFRCDHAWNTGTVTLGGLVGTEDDDLQVRVDLSSAARFPSVDEQYIHGTAPTAPVYSVGDPGLGVETTWSASTSAHVHVRWLHADVSPFASYVDDYIQLGPDADDPFEVIVRGAFPRFVHTRVNAVFTGIDGSFVLGPDAPVQLAGQGSYLVGSTANGEPLPLVPPAFGRLAATWHPPQYGAIVHPFVEFNVSGFARQTRQPAFDFAPAPAGVVMLGARVGTDVEVGDDVARLSLEATNLLDSPYRSYTSLLRYYADQPGRDVVLRTAFHLDF